MSFGAAQGESSMKGTEAMASQTTAATTLESVAQGDGTIETGTEPQITRWRERDKGQHETRTVIVGVAASIALLVIGFFNCALAVLALAIIAIYTRLSTQQMSAYRFCRKAERDLKQRTTEVTKETRGRLLRVVMHDLRSPLLSVANSAAVLDDLLKKKPATCLDDPIVIECHNVIATCSTLMQNLLADMLEFERIDSGKLVLVPAKLHASQLLQATAETFGVLAASRGMTLRIELLPPALDASVFVDDVRRLQQCLNNGVTNAINFTHAPRRVVCVVHRGRRHGDHPRPPGGCTQRGISDVALSGCSYHDQARSLNKPSLVFEVDSGVGFSPSELLLANEGEAFVQVSRGQLNGSGGTGLGLNIVRNMWRNQVEYAFYCTPG
ncbi:hypothetical protein T492DRAFT_1149863 [Pavlovales sp. CCMP2436]|nr:hypothetical protein T492DRAFT_1149863 [Pavlovales sp. CCMP2436]